VTPVFGCKFGFSIQLNDNDGDGLAAHMNWGGGLSPTWRPADFGTITLVEAPWLRALRHEPSIKRAFRAGLRQPLAAVSTRARSRAASGSGSASRWSALSSISAEAGGPAPSPLPSSPSPHAA